MAKHGLAMKLFLLRLKQYIVTLKTIPLWVKLHVHLYISFLIQHISCRKFSVVICNPYSSIQTQKLNDKDCGRKSSQASVLLIVHVWMIYYAKFGTPFLTIMWNVESWSLTDMNVKQQDIQTWHSICWMLNVVVIYRYNISRHQLANERKHINI